MRIVIILVISCAMQLCAMEKDSDNHAQKGELIEIVIDKGSDSERKSEPIALVENRSSKEHEYIIVRSLKELEDIERSQKEKNRLTVNEKEKKRLSVIVMSGLDLETLSKKEEPLSSSGSSDSLTDEELLQFADFFAQFSHRKISRVAKPFAHKIREVHQTPPGSPDGAEKIKKIKEAYGLLQQVYKQQQETSREITTARGHRNRIEHDLAECDELLARARAPKPEEWVEKHPHLKQCICALEDLAAEVIEQELDKTDSALGRTETNRKRTLWGGIVGAAVTSGASALITYLGTKKSC